MAKAEIIFFRSTHSKRELKQRFGDVSKKLNDLIETDLGEKKPRDWREILERPAPEISDAAYELCLKPE